MLYFSLVILAAVAILVHWLKSGSAERGVTFQAYFIAPFGVPKLQHRSTTFLPWRVKTWWESEIRN